MSISWFLFETVGTIAFAVSGSMVAYQKRMDIFGVAVLSILTAVGGGILRDLLMGITPPLAFRTTSGLLLPIGTALVVSVLYTALKVSRKEKKYLMFMYNISDTVGLAAFTVTGALMGLGADNHPYILPITLGMSTGIGGGILRDLMAQRVPVVLRMDVYASASLAGGLALCAVWHFGYTVAASWVGFSVVMLLRLGAIYFGWQLYHPRPLRSSRKKSKSCDE